MRGSYTAIIAGATGLVGALVLQKLLDSQQYSKITVLTRRSLERPDVLLNEVITDFEDLDLHLEHLHGDHVFCCLGTTIKKAGSNEAFELVDVEYPGRLAELTLSRNSKHFLLVSAMGANPKSSIFYSRMKGVAEDRILNSGFPKVTVLRPGLILGDRQESRPGESIAQAIFKVINPILVGPLKRLKANRAQDIAATMVESAWSQKESANIIEAPRIHSMNT